MTLWILASLLILLALLLILPPLLRKDLTYGNDRREQNISIAKQQLAQLAKEHESGNISDTDYASTKAELEQSLYQDLQESDADNTKKTAKGRGAYFSLAVVGLFVPLLSLAIYLLVGTPQAIHESSRVVVADENGMPDINAMITRLEQRLEKEPNDAEGWFMLARTYSVLKRFDEAVTAYEKSIAIDNKNPQAFFYLADTLAVAKQGDLRGRPEELIQQGLALKADSQMGLWLAGIAARQSNNNAQALAYLQKLYPLLNESPTEQQEVAKLIQQLGGQTSSPSTAPVAVPTPAPVPAATAPVVAPTPTQVPQPAPAVAQAPVAVPTPTPAPPVATAPVTAPIAPSAPPVAPVATPAASPVQAPVSQPTAAVTPPAAVAPVETQPTAPVTPALVPPSAPPVAPVSQPVPIAAAPTPAPAVTPPASTNTQAVTVTIDIADSVKAQVSPEQTVFIYAKAVQGPPMPLAAARKQVKDFPLTLVLDDSMAMMPQMKISAFPQVKVGARISLSGQPTAQKGDWYQELSPVNLGSSIQLLIDRQL
ncbi:MAG: c-type cytochrome biogenesis protein CcmI [bacterium]